MKDWKQFLLNESSLSRVLSHIQQHDCAVITAFRDDPDDTSYCVGGISEQQAPPSAETGGNDVLEKNKERNRILWAALLQLGYGVTAVEGSYIENYLQDNQVEVKEGSKFVVNLNNDPQFIDNIKMLGSKFCQDSVMIIPQGGQDAYLIGTNNADFPGYGNSWRVGNFKAGREAEIMTLVNKRPFVFSESKEYKLETLKNYSWMGRWAIYSMSKQVLKG